MMSHATTEQLDSQLTQPKKPSGKGAKRAGASAAQQAKKPLTEAELRQHVLEIGLMSQLPGNPSWSPR